MKTYQDLILAGESERNRMIFVANAIREHGMSREYRMARDAELYYKQENPTITRYQKIVYDLLGRPVVDSLSANHKIASNWYFYFTVQSVQYLLGNGVTFKDAATKERLGKDFDSKLQKLATYAKNGGVAYAFFNVDHLDIFRATEFVPLLDEETGALRAGIRFWQIDKDKPLRATLYEEDGYTDYIRRDGDDMKVFADKRKYQETVYTNEVGTEILEAQNYPGFPIVPLWNINRQSDLVGKRGVIDAYDLMASKLVNNVSEGDLIYWVLKNADGMDDLDDIQFVERLRTIHVAHTNGSGADVESHKVEAPYEANEVALNQLKGQLFADFMALNVEQIQAGNVTATQIMAAYEPLNQKTDLFEYEVIDFIQAILTLAGIDDEPTFKRSQIANQAEDVQKVLMAAPYLDDETILNKLSFLTQEEVETILQRRDAEGLRRMTGEEPMEE